MFSCLPVHYGCRWLLSSKNGLACFSAIVVIAAKGGKYFWFKSRFYPTNNYWPVVVAKPSQMKSFSKFSLAHRSRSAVFWKILEMFKLLFDLLGLNGLVFLDHFLAQDERGFASWHWLTKLWIVSSDQRITQWYKESTCFPWCLIKRFGAESDTGSLNK